jgi:drug/metabolite transporter (DMT)-like permease
VFVPVPTWPRPQDYLYLLVLGGIMSATTYAIYFRLVSTIGPTTAISVEFAVTTVAVAVGALLLREPITAVQIGGGVFIICGCALVLGLFSGRRDPGRPNPPPAPGGA